MDLRSYERCIVEMRTEPVPTKEGVYGLWDMAVSHEKIVVINRQGKKKL